MTSTESSRSLTKEEAEILAQILTETYPLTLENIDSHNRADFDIAIRVIHALQPRPQSTHRPSASSRHYLKVVK